MSEVPPVTMVRPERAETPPARGPGAVPRGLAAISGIVAALAALGVGELFAGLIAGVPSPIAAVGSAVIDFAPPGSKDFMVSLFGTNDKTALTVVVVAVVVLVGALVGLLARRSYGLAIAVILGFVGVGLLASLRVAGNSMTLVLVSAALQAGVAIFVLDALMTAARAAGRDDDRIAGPNSGAPLVPRPCRRPRRPGGLRRLVRAEHARGACRPGDGRGHGDPARPPSPPRSRARTPRSRSTA